MYHLLGLILKKQNHLKLACKKFESALHYWGGDTSKTLYPAALSTLLELADTKRMLKDFTYSQDALGNIITLHHTAKRYAEEALAQLLLGKVYEDMSYFSLAITEISKARLTLQEVHSAEVNTAEVLMGRVLIKKSNQEIQKDKMIELTDSVKLLLEIIRVLSPEQKELLSQYCSKLGSYFSETFPEKALDYFHSAANLATHPKIQANLFIHFSLCCHRAALEKKKYSASDKKAITKLEGEGTHYYEAVLREYGNACNDPDDKLILYQANIVKALFEFEKNPKIGLDSFQKAENYHAAEKLKPFLFTLSIHKKLAEYLENLSETDPNIEIAKLAFHQCKIVHFLVAETCDILKIREAKEKYQTMLEKLSKNTTLSPRSLSLFAPVIKTNFKSLEPDNTPALTL